MSCTSVTRALTPFPALGILHGTIVSTRARDHTSARPAMNDSSAVTLANATGTLNPVAGYSTTRKATSRNNSPLFFALPGRAHLHRSFYLCIFIGVSCLVFCSQLILVCARLSLLVTIRFKLHICIHSCDIYTLVHL
jgi:hypothetical protein